MLNTYLLLYSGGNMPATEADQKQVMDAWNSWFAKHGDAISDGGNPFTAKAKTIGSDGKVTDGAFAAATGYTLIKADSLDHAVEIAKGCPVLIGAPSWRSTRLSTQWLRWRDPSRRTRALSSVDQRDRRCLLRFDSLPNDRPGARGSPEGYERQWP